MAVPKGYMDEMAQGWNDNGVLHMCRDNSFLCDFVDACKFRLTLPEFNHGCNFAI